MKIAHLGLLISILAGWCCATSRGQAASAQEAAPAAAVVIGARATPLERFAAEELCGYLQKLYEIKSQPVDAVPQASSVIFLLGDPDTNPVIAQALAADGWPRLSDQGIVLKRGRLKDKPALVVGGGSPKATLWAVYELAERWGVRYLLHGDVLPDNAGPLRLPAEDVVKEPLFPIRQWRVVNDFACGPESWGMVDYRPLLDQLAKLKFNRILISTYVWQPFLHLEVDGVARRSAWLWYQWHYPITDDMPGRRLFGAAREFWNPDLPLGASYGELAGAGEKLMHNLMAYAHQRGMECVLTANVTAFPHEFKDLLKGCQPLSSLSRYTMIPGPDTDLDDPGLKKLAAAVLRTSVNTYPEVDSLQLGVTEVRKWSGQYERAWKALDAKYRLSSHCTLEQVLARAGGRTGYPGGAERAAAEVKADLAVLYFLDRLIRESDVFRNTRRPNVRLVYESFAEELYPLLESILPPGSETLNFVDYTPARILRRQETLGALGHRKIPAALIYTLEDDNVGLVPQLTTGSLAKLTGELRRHGWAGFSTRYWLVAPHNPCVQYLARAAWDAEATPAGVYSSLIEQVCGQPCVADMLQCFEELERTTVLLEMHCMGLAFATPGMFTQHFQPGAMPETYASIREGYRRALAAVRRAAAKTRPGGKPFVDYWIGRMQFGVGYFDCIEAARHAATVEAQASKAKDSGDAALAQRKRAEAAEQWNRALEISRRMLEDYAQVAVDQSDRGAIAVLAEYVYRPLKAKADKQSKP